MDRSEALKNLPELSAGCLDAATEAAVQRWVDDCPHCKAEWASLQGFLGTLEKVPPAPLSEAQSQQMWAHCSQSLFDKVEQDRLKAQNPPLWGWMKSQPRWGWAMLGGAVAILGAAILAPESSPSDPPIFVASAARDAANPGELQSLGRPPSYAATMVDHHAQMAIDPFSDRVGSSLVSYSASYPIAREGVSR